MSYAVHRNVTFFLSVCDDFLSMADFCIIINENFTEYSSNVVLSYTSYINKYILTVSSKKIIVNMLFYSELTLPPPLRKGYSSRCRVRILWQYHCLVEINTNFFQKNLIIDGRYPL